MLSNCNSTSNYLYITPHVENKKKSDKLKIRAQIENRKKEQVIITALALLVTIIHKPPKVTSH